MLGIVELLNRLSKSVGQPLNVEAAGRLLGLPADAHVQQLIEALTDRNTEGLMTADERAEYEVLVTAAELVAVLRAKARRGRRPAPPRLDRW